MTARKGTTMKKAFVLLLIALIVLASATVALAYPGTVLWKEECPPWATLRVNETPTGWVGVECFTFDAMGKR